jgi:hypothetical protein
MGSSADLWCLFTVGAVAGGRTTFQQSSSCRLALACVSPHLLHFAPWSGAPALEWQKSTPASALGRGHMGLQVLWGRGPRTRTAWRVLGMRTLLGVGTFCLERFGLLCSRWAWGSSVVVLERRSAFCDASADGSFFVECACGGTGGACRQIRRSSSVRLFPSLLWLLR